MKKPSKKIVKLRKQNMAKWTEQDHAFYKEVLDVIPDTNEPTEQEWKSFKKMLKQKKEELLGKKKKKK